jgi:hypothetical protein
MFGVSYNANLVECYFGESVGKPMQWVLGEFYPNLRKPM